MRILVVAVGRLRDRPLRAAADEYLKRIRRYARCDEIEVRDGAALARPVPEGAHRIALEVDGEQVASLDFARRVERWGASGKGELAFLIGGADGIPADLSRAASSRLSLSRLTLPHRLARVLLYEQLYRAFTLIRGEPYARED
ncbi:MAG TPA: 23S rRNA (pseudouridine(1915)-N(3))-methyltransferase RlmH [Polyangiaceae bacterium]|nr:23S rRNA (pseudouridine(1915)-N(3))-methyltransferase RlmH [Polyangiaceae bacterium]